MMSSDTPLYLLFLWHQHQPFYKDPLTNRYELPWVRLHATKDYYDMVAVLDEYPTIKSNFNLVPSLLIQLDEYASGVATDRSLELTAKAAATLTSDDKQYLLENFFMANWDRMIDPNPRYRELLEKRGRRTFGDDLRRIQTYFKEHDWRDLQVWFNLAWFDPLWRERDTFVRTLYEKGKNFSEDEKLQLLAKQREICGLVVSKHREALERGQIDVTATPFYHPILPLLCDTDAAKMAMPQAALPRQRFMHPEDAKLQIERALQDHERRFGHRPAGMWPSEGSVSEPVARLFADAGVRWVATDEAVLANSGGKGYDRSSLYQAHRLSLGDKSLHFFFRDHELSDAIGFVYASWNANDAVEDFLKRLRSIRDRLKQHDTDRSRPHVVPVILDGENCWEYYDQDGLPFLRQLYKRLSEESSWIQTVRVSEYLDQHESEAAILPKLWSGSWINSNFAIWIGHREDNQAWDALYEARQFLTRYIEGHPGREKNPEVQQAWEEIYIAEGSDWCWWYGDDHSSANDATFDYLFRKHLMNVYTLLGAKVPQSLHAPIKGKRLDGSRLAPVDFISPTLDGKVTNYFEWQSAGRYLPAGGGTGTMHRVERWLKAHYYGFNKSAYFLRFDFEKPNAALAGLTLRILATRPENFTFAVRFTVDQPELQTTAANGQLKIAYMKVLEIEVPLAMEPALTSVGLEYIVTIEKDGQEIERWPSDLPITLPAPTIEAFADNWNA